MTAPAAAVCAPVLGLAPPLRILAPAQVWPHGALFLRVPALGPVIFAPSPSAVRLNNSSAFHWPSDSSGKIFRYFPTGRPRSRILLYQRCREALYRSASSAFAASKCATFLFRVFTVPCSVLISFCCFSFCADMMLFAANAFFWRSIISCACRS